MSHQEARRWFVSGGVQGVGFRYFAQREARALGLTGWARNLDDGRVEVYAAGRRDCLDDMAAALHVGPAMADVRSVEERAEPVQNQSDFNIL
ncbi:MAG TPA: acylphosphatase [Bryobacteraceae bacterium]|nr:acylphosphatase [Bryobacteraceae bacterium]